jgi:hypothetical protein
VGACHKFVSELLSYREFRLTSKCSERGMHKVPLRLGQQRVADFRR